MTADIISGFNLSFDQGIAQTVGVDAAIVFNHILYWLKINAKKQEMVDGKFWMYESQKDMADFFGFMEEKIVMKSIKKLIDAGLIEQRRLSNNPFDRTYWYTVCDQGLIKKSLRNCQNGSIETDLLAVSDTPKMAVCIKTIEDKEKEEEEAKTQASASSAAFEDYEELSDSLVQTHGLKISAIGIRRCVKLYGRTLCKKVIELLKKEPREKDVRDKTAIFTALCKEFDECK